MNAPGMRGLCGMGALFVGLWATEAKADVPMRLTHQGRLFDAAGQPVTGTINVEFNLYDDPTAGMPVWTENHAIAFEEGFYSVRLGDDVSLAGLFASTQLYLGVTVGADPEMTPRASVNSVPYAFTASDAIGDIHPTSVSIGATTVINDQGEWVGDPSGLIGPAGPQGPSGPQGPAGPSGMATATAPLSINGSDVSINTSGCNTGDVLRFNGSGWGCQKPQFECHPIGTSFSGAQATVNCQPNELAVSCGYTATTGQMSTMTPGAGMGGGCLCQRQNHVDGTVAICNAVCCTFF